MKNIEVAKAYALGNTEKHTKNLFIEKETIYSYGYHFPIATRINTGTGTEYKQWYIFTNSSYSQTTAVHKSYVRHALSGQPVIFVDSHKLNIEAIRKQEKTNQTNIKQLKEKEQVRKSKIRQEEIQHLEAQQELIKEFMQTAEYNQHIAEKTSEEL